MISIHKPLLALAATVLSSQFLIADTTLFTNVNGYTLDANRELQQFSAIQFSDDRIDRVYKSDEELAQQVDTILDAMGKQRDLANSGLSNLA